MRTKIDRTIAICLLVYGIPIILIGRGEWELGFLGTVIFFLAYLLTTFAKSVRNAVKILDAFVFSSYAITSVGCWVLYSNGYDNSESIWIYIGLVVLGFPIFKKIQNHLQKELN